MNTKQAKAEPLHEFLGRMGYQPAHVRGNDIWYRSPFRPTERTPSFKIDRTKNVWFDHGLGAGGTIIDFVQHLGGTTDISRVLSTISDVLGNAPRPVIVLPDAPERPRDPPVGGAPAALFRARPLRAAGDAPDQPRLHGGDGADLLSAEA